MHRRVDLYDETTMRAEGKRIFVCSPYRAASPEEFSDNISLAETGCLYVINQGGFPFAPHLYLPNLLDDSVPELRQLGMASGIAFLQVCHELWVIGERISSGMADEIAYAEAIEIPVVYVSYEDLEYA